MAKIFMTAGRVYEVNNEQLTQASKLVDEARSKKEHRIVQVGTHEFHTADYRGGEYDIIPDGEEDSKRQAREFHTKRKEFAKLHPEEKTDNFMKNVAPIWTSIIKTNEALLKEKVLAFFVENPLRTLPHGSVFNGTFDETEKSRRTDNWDSAKLRILENHLGADAQYAKEDEKFQMANLGIKPEDLKRDISLENLF